VCQNSNGSRPYEKENQVGPRHAVLRAARRKPALREGCLRPYGSLGTLDSSLQQLYPQLLRGGRERDNYTDYYAAGSTAKKPEINAPWNPTNTGNWPIFSCTIGEVPHDKRPAR